MKNKKSIITYVALIVSLLVMSIATTLALVTDEHSTSESVIKFDKVSIRGEACFFGNHGYGECCGAQVAFRYVQTVIDQIVVQGLFCVTLHQSVYMIGMIVELLRDFLVGKLGVCIMVMYKFLYVKHELIIAPFASVLVQKLNKRKLQICRGGMFVIVSFFEKELNAGGYVRADVNGVLLNDRRGKFLGDIVG